MQVEGRCANEKKDAAILSDTAEHALLEITPLVSSREFAAVGPR
jgi:hypothetical protein